jgi:hypothetical protein
MTTVRTNNILLFMGRRGQQHEGALEEFLVQRASKLNKKITAAS